jgi:hypothetical protein
VSLQSTVPAIGQQVTSGANAAGVITLPAVAGRTYTLKMLLASYSLGSGVPSATAPGRVTVQDGATTILEFDITGPGNSLPPIPDGGISGTTGNSMTITLAAGGTASVGRLSIAYTI